MGCATSKQKRCPHCRNSTTQRSNSLHTHRSPPRNSDGYHVVAFSSTTFGSLKLENLHFDNKIYTAADDDPQTQHHETKNQIPMALIEAKTWSEMINSKIPKIAPKTPIMTPPGEPETINVWEVMEGLDDISPFRPTCRARSFSFDVSATSVSASLEQRNSNSKLQEIDDSSTSPKPFWLKPAGNLIKNIFFFFFFFGPQFNLAQGLHIVRDDPELQVWSLNFYVYIYMIF